jgi:O-antigen/teichoic acid export membrane protein
MRLAGFVIGTLATVGSSVVIIRHLGVVDTGRWVTVMALIVIIGSISDLGLSAVGVREYTVRPRPDGERFLRNLLGIRLAFVVVGLAIGVAFTVAARYTTTMVIGTLLAGAGMALYVIQQSLTIPLQVHLRFGWVASLQMAFQVGVAVEGALLALAGAGLLPFFVLWLPVLIPITALNVVVGGRETRILPAADAVEWRRMLREILP